MVAIDAGYRVTGIDLDDHKVSQMSSGLSPIEDVTHATLQSALASGRFTVSTDYSAALGFDVAVITVPTPLKRGEPDLSFIESSGKAIAQQLGRGATVILESTTYPGTTEELLVPLLERTSGLRAREDFLAGYSPERIDPGNPTWNLRNTPKIVSGINSDSLAQVKNFYESLGITTVPVSGTREAELTKLLENTFRHVNIALVNELAKFSRFLGANIWEAIDAASTKPFGFMKFTPGPGVGGHCLPIDPTYLSWAIKDRSGSDFKFVSLANDVNRSMPDFVRQRAEELLGKKNKELSGSKIIILGLAYKADTGDTRESPSIALAEALSSRGALVVAVDTHVSNEQWPIGIPRASKSDATVYDLAILLTNHSGLREHWALTRSDYVLDTRNCLNGPNVEQL